MTPFLLIGLGNPGTKYEHTRHNVGFMAVDAISQRYNFPAFKSKFNALCSQGKISGKPVLLVKPQTFMNLSGEAVLNAMQFYKLSPERMIVIHDEFALPVGEIKLKKSGGNAGHNGLKSIDELIGNAYPRIRIGIGPLPEFGDVSDFVLSKFSASDRKTIDRLIRYIAENIKNIITTFETQNFTNKKFIERSPENLLIDVSASVPKTIAE